MTDFRGATVEDLDSPPALTVTPSTRLSEALELSYELSYSYLPVVSTKDKRLLGYLTAGQLQKLINDPAQLDSLVRDHYVRFKKSSVKPFKPITPQTPLEQLQKFFEQGEEFAVITDSDAKFIIGVATKEDLQKFLEHRPNIV